MATISKGSLYLFVGVFEGVAAIFGRQLVHGYKARESDLDHGTVE